MASREELPGPPASGSGGGWRRPAVVSAAAIALALLLWPAPGVAHQAKEGERLAKIGPAPDFTLTTTDGGRLSLSDLRGKIVAVTFIYATCTDTCPLLTAKMAGMQKRLGPDFGPRVRFLSITVDPEEFLRDVWSLLREAQGP